MRLAFSFLLLTTAFGAVAPPVQNASDSAVKQAAAASAMQASVDKQKAAVRAQVGTGGPADAFSTPWTTPASVTPPNLVAPCEAMQESDLKPIVTEAAKAQDVKPEIILAVVKRGVGFLPLRGL